MMTMPAACGCVLTLDLAERHAAITEPCAAHNGDWFPSRWWRVIAPDGQLRTESTVEAEARARVQPGDRIERHWLRERLIEWRPA